VAPTTDDEEGENDHQDDDDEDDVAEVDGALDHESDASHDFENLDDLSWLLEPSTYVRALAFHTSALIREMFIGYYTDLAPTRKHELLFVGDVFGHLLNALKSAPDDTTTGSTKHIVAALRRLRNRCEFYGAPANAGLAEAAERSLQNTNLPKDLRRSRLAAQKARQQQERYAPQRGRGRARGRGRGAQRPDAKPAVAVARTPN
jgi:hypothetical protein